MSDLRPEYIVIHTAAFAGSDCDRDLIDDWHRARGWNGIGYHFVIVNDRHSELADGTVQSGRRMGTPGAHVEGLNMRSIGICCAGNGDLDPFTGAQLESLVKLVSGLIDEYPALGVDSVIGHREINRLVAEGLIEARYRTSKSCPGRKIDMDDIRARVRSYRLSGSVTVPAHAATRRRAAAARPVPTADELREALDVVSRAAPRLGNSADELHAFLRHPEVLDVRGLRRPDDGGDGRPEDLNVARPGGGGGGGRPDE